MHVPQDLIWWESWKNFEFRGELNKASAKKVFVESFLAVSKEASLLSVFLLTLGKELLCRVSKENTR